MSATEHAVPEKEIVITVEVGWQALVLLAALIVVLVAALFIGAFYDFLLFILKFFYVPLTEVTLSGEYFRGGDLVEVRICVSRWVKADELAVYVIDPEGSVTYHSGSINPDSEGCTSVTIRLSTTAEGVHTVAAVRRHLAIAVARFSVERTP